jgi:hypothetical protein
MEAATAARNNINASPAAGVHIFSRAVHKIGVNVFSHAVHKIGVNVFSHAGDKIFTSLFSSIGAKIGAVFPRVAAESFSRSRAQGR